MTKSDQDLVLCMLFAMIVLGRWKQLKKALLEAVHAGIPFTTIREIFLQSHLFAGFPKTIEAFEVLASIGAMGEIPAEEFLVEEQRDFSGRGKELFQKIYANYSDSVLERIGSFHPNLKEWILQHAYGRVLSRPGLSAKQRELAAVAALTVTRQWRQLLSHMRGAKRCGAKAAEILAVINALSSLSPPAVIAKAKRIISSP